MRTPEELIEYGFTKPEHHEREKLAACDECGDVFRESKLTRTSLGYLLCRRCWREMEGED